MAGRYACHDTERLAHRIDVDAGSGAIGELALHQVRRTDAELYHFKPALDVALGVCNRLSVLAREQFGQGIIVALSEFKELHQDAGPPLRVGGSPLKLCVDCGLDCRIDFAGIRKGDPPANLARHGFEDLGMSAAGSGDPVSFDEMPIVDHDVRSPRMAARIADT
jgi:hypothetical protein